MNVRKFYGVLLLFITLSALADMPGNHRRQDIKVVFSNLSALGNYTLHVKDFDTDSIITKDTLYTIFASQGVPHEIMIYASLDTVFTDSIFLSEAEQENVGIAFTGIADNKLLYTTTRTSLAGDNENAGKGKDGITKSVRQFWKRNEILIGISLVAVLILVVYFFWRKKKTSIGQIE
jgi:hypothetical protein